MAHLKFGLGCGSLIGGARGIRDDRAPIGQGDALRLEAPHCGRVDRPRQVWHHGRGLSISSGTSRTPAPSTEHWGRFDFQWRSTPRARGTPHPVRLLFSAVTLTGRTGSPVTSKNSLARLHMCESESAGDSSTLPPLNFDNKLCHRHWKTSGIVSRPCIPRPTSGAHGSEWGGRLSFFSATVSSGYCRHLGKCRPAGRQLPRRGRRRRKIEPPLGGEEKLSRREAAKKN